MDDVLAIIIVCSIQVIIYLLGVLLTYGHFRGYRGLCRQDGHEIDPTEVIGCEVPGTHASVLVNPASFTDVILNDPRFNSNRYFPQYLYANMRTDIDTMRAYATGALRIILRRSIQGTNLPTKLAFLRKCLVILHLLDTMENNYRPNAIGDIARNSPPPVY